MNKKIFIIIVAIIVICIAICLLWPKNSTTDNRPAAVQEITTQNGTTVIKTTRKDGYIIVADNDYGGKDYKFTVKSRKN